MLSRIFNKAVKGYLGTRFRRIERMRAQSPQLQEQVWQRLLAQSAGTQFGNEQGIHAEMGYSEWSQSIAVQTYESMWPYIQRMLMGEANVLTPGVTTYFAKSAGTTAGKSKYLPINKRMLHANLIQASWESMSCVYNRRPSAQNFQEKNLILGGTLSPYPEYEKSIVGDVSAIMLHTMPAPGRPFYCPDFETALWSDWDKKLDRVAEIASQENIVMFAGVPTWNLVLFEKILERTGKSNMLEVWPNLKTYMHGGVGFDPYREYFQRLIPSDDFDYMEIYNASEGYLAIQDDIRPGMMLLTDHEIFFEFIPIEDLHQEKPTILRLEDLEVGHKYALLITTAAGLYRYMIGDMIELISQAPYRIKIAGRTKQYINVFGEELMIGNAEQAIAEIASAHQVKVRDYTVAPMYMDKGQRGGHQWLIEFDAQPNNLSQFAAALDDRLQQINTDYQAKRYGDLALQSLQVEALERGTFERWLRSKGKVGAQIKVPRLSNDRKVVEEILALVHG